MLKLEKELNSVVEAFKNVDEHKLLQYIDEVKKENEYNSLEIRIVNDLLKLRIGTATICTWYEKYGCNDTHITSLAKKAFKIVYPDINLSN